MRYKKEKIYYCSGFKRSKSCSHIFKESDFIIKDINNPRFDYVICPECGKKNERYLMSQSIRVVNSNYKKIINICINSGILGLIFWMIGAFTHTILFQLLANVISIPALMLIMYTNF